MTTQPTISVLIPTYNAERHLRICLESLRSQAYPQEKIEVIVIDDLSTDQTVSVAKQFGAKVIKSGARHIERSKSLGLAQATGELILLIDADIRLTAKDWLTRMVQPLVDDPQIVGAQAIYWQYRPQHSLINRYCELFGVNDPFVVMLGKRGVLSPIEKRWLDPRVVVEERPSYFLAEFSSRTLPTLGSQGYLTRRKLLIEQTSWDPYFFHLDTVHELVAQGHNRFALMKLSVEHDYADTIPQFYRKLQRNMDLYWKYRPYRQFQYGLGSAKFFLVLFLMMTILYPLWQSLRGFIKQPDLAWLLHPLFCFTVPLLYTAITLKWKAAAWLKTTVASQ